MTTWTARLEIDVDELRSLADGEPEQRGEALALALGYAPAQLAHVPLTALAAFQGAACPFGERFPARGERVVVLGPGAVVDGYVAARRVGIDGAVIGLDTDGARIAAAWSGWYEGAPLDQLSFGRADLGDLPVASGWADVVILNGALESADEPERVLREVARVLRSGGRLVISGHRSYRFHPSRDLTRARNVA